MVSNNIWEKIIFPLFNLKFQAQIIIDISKS